MEGAVDVKYRPALLRNGAAAAAVAKRLTPAAPAAAADGVYRECLKNHAANLGGHAVDGCGEFMPAADPASLACAACGCHRNFHRRLPSAPAAPSPPRLLALPPPPPQHLFQENRPLCGEETPDDRLPAVGYDDSDESDDGSDFDDDRPLSPLPAPATSPAHGRLSSLPRPHVLLGLSTGAPGSSPAPAVAASRPLAPQPGAVQAPGSAPAPATAAPKRFRTKFSPEQKQQMQALSERLGWRLQKRDEAVVDQSCREIGVTKGVFKVWMHNNKHNFVGGFSARRSASATATAAVHPLPQPHSHAAAPTPPAAAAPARFPPWPVLTDFNVNGAPAAAADYLSVRPATASGGSPQTL